MPSGDLLLGLPSFSLPGLPGPNQLQSPNPSACLLWTLSHGASDKLMTCTFSEQGCLCPVMRQCHHMPTEPGKSSSKASRDHNKNGFSHPHNRGLKVHSLGCEAALWWRLLGDRISIFCLELVGRKGDKNRELLWARLQEVKYIYKWGHRLCGENTWGRTASHSQGPCPSYRNPLKLVRCHTSAISAPGKLRYENCKEFKVSLGYIVSPRAFRGTEWDTTSQKSNSR